MGIRFVVINLSFSGQGDHSYPVVTVRVLPVNPDQNVAIVQQFDLKLYLTPTHHEREDIREIEAAALQAARALVVPEAAKALFHGSLPA